MLENATTHEPETTDETPAEADEPKPDAADAPQADDGAKGNKEAAKYRARLREVEAERDRIAGQLATMHRAEVERLAADRLADPTDLWVAEVDVATLIGDDGKPDAGKVDAAVAAVLGEHPAWAASRLPARPRPDPDQGRDNPPNTGRSWADALRGDG